MPTSTTKIAASFVICTIVASLQANQMRQRRGTRQRMDAKPQMDFLLPNVLVSGSESRFRDRRLDDLVGLFDPRQRQQL
jgi:hypothetical protein